MMKQQLELLRIFEKRFGRCDAEKVNSHLNDFTMITVEQTVDRATSSLRHEISNVGNAISHLQTNFENKLEKDILRSQQTIVKLMLTISGILLAAITIFIAVLSVFLNK